MSNPSKPPGIAAITDFEMIATDWIVDAEGQSRVQLGDARQLDTQLLDLPPLDAMWVFIAGLTRVAEALVADDAHHNVTERQPLDPDLGEVLAHAEAAYEWCRKMADDTGLGFLPPKLREFFNYEVPGLVAFVQRGRGAKPKVCNTPLGAERYCALDAGHAGDCDPQPKVHEHGYTTRDGLGFLPVDAGCTGCCEVATEAYRATLGTAAQPTTDAEQILAAALDKAAETAGDGGE